MNKNSEDIAVGDEFYKIYPARAGQVRPRAVRVQVVRTSASFITVQERDGETSRFKRHNMQQAEASGVWEPKKYLLSLNDPEAHRILRDMRHAARFANVTSAAQHFHTEPTEENYNALSEFVARWGKLHGFTEEAQTTD